MNQKTTVMVVIGTRPEAVKMAPVIQCLRQQDWCEALLCVTGQHREMMDQVLQIFQLKPDIDLNLMSENQSLADSTAAILTSMNDVFREHKPDWVLIQGDTTTVMATALAAYYNQVKVGHVEAGLRSFNKWAPFPEEINRKIASDIADLHFAPTANARANLLRESVPDALIHVTGNTVIDALQVVARMPFWLEGSQIAGIPFDSKTILTVTAHRRENHGQPLQDICQALLTLSEKYADSLHIVFPVHLNPAVKQTVHALLGERVNISLLDPLDYLTLVNLLKRTRILLTDSGGLQEEAPGLGVPVLVLREVTERPEGVASGNVHLVGSDQGRIVEEVSRLLDDPLAWEKMATARNPYGDGKAAQKIVQLLLENS